jgi:hypothetical protein
VFDWLWDRILSPKRLDYLIDKLGDRAQDLAKETAISLMEDEDIAQGLTMYGDALYDRYSRKFFGAIGGTQKGINYAIQGATEGSLPPIFDDEGNISLKQIVAYGVQKALSGSFNVGSSSSKRPVRNPFRVE